MPYVTHHFISYITFRKLATNYRALLWEMTCTDKACYDSKPPFHDIVSLRAIVKAINFIAAVVRRVVVHTCVLHMCVLLFV